MCWRDRCSWGESYRRHLGVRALNVVRVCGEECLRVRQPTCARGGRVVRRNGVRRNGVFVMERVSRKFGDVGSCSLRNAKGLTSASGPGRSLLSWRNTWRDSPLGSIHSTATVTTAGYRITDSRLHVEVKLCLPRVAPSHRRVSSLYAGCYVAGGARYGGHANGNESGIVPSCYNEWKLKYEILRTLYLDPITSCGLKIVKMLKCASRGVRLPRSTSSR